MNKILTALLVAGVAALPQIASADDMAASSAMAKPMMVCHAAKAGETATAMTMSKTALVCSDMDMKKMMAGPDMTNVKTAKDADKAWREFLAHQLDAR
jgi:hypothetical protein